MTEISSPEDEAAQLLAGYVRKGKLMQVATSTTDGLPWLAHCWYASDASLRLIFLSRADRRHSQHIEENAHVAGGIIAIPLEGLGQKIRGVTFEGTAAMVGDDALDDAYATYCRRWPQVENMISVGDLRTGSTGNRLWCISPTNYVLFDEVNFPTDPRRELTSW
jgi:uncharacterized protein YhbP (UPF0306 family)